MPQKAAAGGADRCGNESQLGDRDWMDIMVSHFIINGHVRNLNWRYLPYIWPKLEAYIREYPLNLRILKFH